MPHSSSSRAQSSLPHSCIRLVSLLHLYTLAYTIWNWCTQGSALSSAERSPFTSSIESDFDQLIGTEDLDNAVQ